MNWPVLFLACFVIGLAMSALSFLLGALHLDVHLPFLHHAHGVHVHAPHAAHGGAHGFSVINGATVMAFLAWFGGSGFLLTSHWRWLTMPALVFATLAGLAGSTVVFWIMAHLLWSPNENMRTEDYRMVGVIGRITSPIRAGGTGELMYSHAGTRHSCGARSADGQAIDKGTEVVVTAYDRGIAYVQRWEDLAAAVDQS